jgi:hypothetical protein
LGAIAKLMAQWYKDQQMFPQRGIEMKLIVFLTLFFSQAAYAQIFSSYRLCGTNHVRTSYLADPLKDRGILIHLHTPTGHLTFMRCGSQASPRLSAEGREQGCFLTHAGKYHDLCDQEVADMRAAKTGTIAFDSTIGLILSGGYSAFTAAGDVFDLYKTWGLRRECTGVSLLMAMVLENYQSRLRTEFMDDQRELNPSLLNLFTMFNQQTENEKWSFTFERLDLLLVPRELRDSRGNIPLPANAIMYFSTLRDNKGYNQFLFETPRRAEFCSAYGF